MRQFLFLAFLFQVFILFSQQVSFNDPDLTFSFKKPKNWKVFDDGYVIKVSPSAADTSTIYLSLTYFSSPKPMGGYVSGESPESLKNVSLTTNIESQTAKHGPSEKIMGQEVQSKEYIQNQDGENLNIRVYTFQEANQQWEILTSAPKDERKKSNKEFRKIMRTLRIH